MRYYSVKVLFLDTVGWMYGHVLEPVNEKSTLCDLQ